MAHEALFIRWFEDLCSEDVPEVGGKNASLGEMIRHLKDEGVRVPGGFATTAGAYRSFLEQNNLEEVITGLMDGLEKGEKPLEDLGEQMRRAFRHGEFPKDVAESIRDAYRELSDRSGRKDISVAVRSSATAEDLPEASFAGQQETFLNVSGEEDLLDACRDYYASLFTDRAISYREERDFDHLDVALSVGVQKMVRSDLASAGVMFSLDTDTGFPDLVVINGSWGLGEMVVQGSVNPDEFRVFKPRLGEKDLKPIIEKRLGAKERKIVYSRGGKNTTRTIDTTARERRRFVLKDEEVLKLARWAASIEDHYKMPMDMEWARDGETGELFCVQARPETFHSTKEKSALKTYRLKGRSGPLVSGTAIGQAIAVGPVKVLESPDEMNRFEKGDVLVTERTDPDWGPVMKKAAAIVADQGGRTSHAAILGRELGIPAIVGSGDGTDRLKEDADITVSCAEGEEGHVYEGTLEFVEKTIDLERIPQAPVTVMINLAAPGAAFRWWRLPVHGVGLARMEFVINNVIRIHPMALARFSEIENSRVRQEIEELTAGYEDKTEYFVDHLARGLASIASSQYPDPVIVRMSDFKTNEYSSLIGGEGFEPEEENPMLGFRGASRYYSGSYREGFGLECRAVRRARGEEIGLDNIAVMIPFVRSPEEADRVIKAMEDRGLKRNRAGLKLFMMCEVPSNVFLAGEFADRFDGFSIGSNDLTQLILGVDRDSEELSGLFDERNEAVKQAIRQVIKEAHQKNVAVGICGQAPSDYPQFARFLVQEGIDSISLNPDSVLEVLEQLDTNGS